MGRRTKYLLQALFFLALGGFFVYLYFSGKAAALQKFSLFGAVVLIFVGLIFLKNSIKK